MTDIRQLTEEYVAAFDMRDLDGVANLFAEDFVLTDSDVTALTPKDSVINYIQRIFSSHKHLSFEARNILVDGNVSVIHFTLILDQMTFNGVDLITWRNQKMSSMQAYLSPHT